MRCSDEGTFGGGGGTMPHRIHVSVVLREFFGCVSFSYRPTTSTCLLNLTVTIITRFPVNNAHGHFPLLRRQKGELLYFNTKSAKRKNTLLGKHLVTGPVDARSVQISDY